MDNHAALTVVGFGLEQVSDDDLLRSVCRLVGQSNRVLAALLAHLAEVEARGLHRVRACASLHTYCIYELRMSEDTAFRRVAASRWVRRFPPLLGAVERGEIHLTGLLLLGPHLTDANCREVMVLAKHRTKKEILALVRRLSPLPDVPSRIEVLGPVERKSVSMNPRWDQFVGAMCPVRELRPGERPADWLSDADESLTCANASEGDLAEPALARSESSETGKLIQLDNEERARSELRTVPLSRSLASSPSPDCETRGEPTSSPLQAAPQLSGPQRYKVQFTASEEYVKLVEEAKALLSHVVPSRTLAEVHLRAMRTLVAELKKRKYAVLLASESPQRNDSLSKGAHAKSFGEGKIGSPTGAHGSVGSGKRPDRVASTALEREAIVRKAISNEAPARETAGRREIVDEAPVDEAPVGEARTSNAIVGVAPESERCVGIPTDLEPRTQIPRQRGRHIPAAVRRAVFVRDAGRCSYVDTLGTRCRETVRLELHHAIPFARGGAHDANNLSLRCTQHNALAAEQDFGREWVMERRSSDPHGRRGDPNGSVLAR
jgi:hypothetical protein